MWVSAGGADVPRPRSRGRRLTSSHRGSRPSRRGSESQAARLARAAEIFARLRTQYPEARCALDHRNAYQLLVATILSAQCTDARVNQVTPDLFRRYPKTADLACAERGELERLIQSTGFFRNKAKNLIAMAQALVADHSGQVPRSMEALRALPGVGRKTANVVLGNAFGINEGIVVDTHVGRLSRLLGLTTHSDPAKAEQDLMLLFPKRQWALLAHLLIFHGRRICIARRPQCGECALRDLCPSAKLTTV